MCFAGVPVPFCWLCDGVSVIVFNFLTCDGAVFGEVVICRGFVVEELVLSVVVVVIYVVEEAWSLIVDGETVVVVVMIECR